MSCIRSSCDCCCCEATHNSQPPYQQTTRFFIANMDCPMEEGIIRKALQSIQGITELRFALQERELTIVHEGQALATIEKTLAAINMPGKRLSLGTVSTYYIADMDCPTEEGLIREKLTLLSGIHSLHFDLVHRTLRIEHDVTASTSIDTTLQSLAMGARLLDVGQGINEKEKRRTPWLRLALAGLLALAAETLDLLKDSLPPNYHYGVLFLALAAIALGGLSTYKKGFLALKSATLNMNALMTVAVTGAILIGQWPEAAMVMVLFALAEIIEARSIERANTAITSLLTLTPQKACVQTDNGEWQEMDVTHVREGAIVQVKPGERIAFDGTITEGASEVNQAPITGESLPVDKVVGSTVYAGTINGSRAFSYRVDKTASETTLAHIVRTVENAQKNRAPIERYVDTFARVYTPTIFLVALVVALLPPLTMGGVWMDWMYRALILLVIACPCALVISTPVSIVSALAAAARKGILIKGGAILERGRALSLIAFDKTGTLTRGLPRITTFVSANNVNEEETKQLLFSLASCSDHPVSKAIVDWGEEEGVEPLPVSSFTALPGKGVEGIVNGRLYALFSHSAAEECTSSATLDGHMRVCEEKGESLALLVFESRILAVVSVADAVKESSKIAIQELHSLGVTTTMLSGDNEVTARYIAEEVHVDHYRGSLLPEEKLQEIERSMARGNVVGMVGDGINDAPALARADIGFAMGAMGTDTALETCDVALMDDDIRKVPAFIRLSKATLAILQQNIVFALGIKLFFVLLTFMGEATMWMAVFADMGTSLIVVGNGLRLLKK